MKTEPDMDNPFKRKLNYLGLRFKKFWIRAYNQLTPPIISKTITKLRKKVVKPDAFEVGTVKTLTLDDISPAELNYRPGSPRIEVPISRMRYAGGLRFDANQHHFVRYLSHGISALNQYYERHQPENILQKHFIASAKGRNLPLKGLPWVMYADGTFDRNVPSEKGLSASHGHQHHGPVSAQKIALEASHMDRLVTSFKKKGLLNTKDCPTGHFLLDDNGDWAFYIKDGQHRISVMAHLGYETAVVKITGGVLPAVSVKDASNWPMVRRGLLTEEEAIAVLRAYTSPDRELDIFDN